MARKSAGKKEKMICPRCGRPIDWIEKANRNGRVYYYAVHYLGSTSVNGKLKKKVKKCYLGPEEYVYVTRTHAKEGLVLKGLPEQYRTIEYLRELLASIVSKAGKMPEQDVQQLIEELNTAIVELKRMLEERRRKKIIEELREQASKNQAGTAAREETEREGRLLTV